MSVVFIVGLLPFWFVFLFFSFLILPLWLLCFDLILLLFLSVVANAAKLICVHFEYSHKLFTYKMDLIQIEWIFWLLQFHVIQMRARCILPYETWNRQTQTKKENTWNNDRMIRFYKIIDLRWKNAMYNKQWDCILFFAAFVAFLSWHHESILRMYTRLRFLLLSPYSVHSFNWKWSEKIKPNKNETMVRLNKIAAKTI